MGIEDTECFKILQNIAGGEVDNDALKRLVAEVQEFQDNYQKIEDIDASVLEQRSKEWMKAKELQLESAKLEAISNVLKSREAIDFIDQFKNPEEGLRTLLGGRTREKQDGGYLGVDQLISVRRNKWLNMLVQEMETRGLFDAFVRGDFERDVMRVLFELKPDGKIPDVPTPAKEIAKIIKAINDDIVSTQRRSGANIGHIEGYIMRQSHDAERIHRPDLDDKGFAKWYESIMRHLDLAKTFGKDAGSKFKMQKVMKGVFDDIISGRRDIAGTKNVSDELVQIIRTRKLGNQIAARRVLHFKSGDDFYQYNKEFGRSHLKDSLLSAIDFNSRSSSLVQMLGTNPEATLLKLSRKYKVVDKEGNIPFSVRNIYRDVSGLTNLPGNNVFAKTGRWLRSLNNVTKLGFAGMASITDFATSAAVLQSATGRDFLSAYTDLMQRWFEGVPRGTRNEWAKRTGIFVNDSLGELYQKFGDVDVRPGMMSKGMRNWLKMEEKFFKVTGLNFVTATGKVAIAKQLAFDLGDVAGKAWDELPDRFKHNLKLYRIEPHDWALMRRSAKSFDGSPIAISPETIRGLDPELVKGHLANEGAENVSDRMASEWIASNSERVAAYLSDMAEHGSPTPGARERAFLLMGFRADEPIGQVLRLWAQFKTFPVSMLSVLRRVATGNPEAGKTFTQAIQSRKGLESVVGLMLGASAMGYMAMIARNALQGKTPPDPMDPEIIKEAFVRGGAGGIYVDYMMGEYDKSYRQFTTDVLGPTAPVINDTAKLWAKTIRGDTDAKDMVDYTIRNFGPNLPILRSTIDYLLLNELRESLSPGTMKRMQKRMDEKGERYFIPQLFGDD